MTIKRDVRRAKREAIEDLLMLRDRAKLKAHLLGMDAHRAFTNLEADVRELETAATRESEHTVEVIKESAFELARALNEFMTIHMNDSVGLLTSVRSLMKTHVRTCRPEDSLNHAAHFMWDDDCGIVPIVSGDRVIGVLTDRDICMATYLQGKPPAELLVESAMSKGLFSCSPDESVGAALAQMADKRVRRLPVVATDGKLLGIIALADVLVWGRPLTNPAVDAALIDTLAAISTRTQREFSVAAE